MNKKEFIWNYLKNSPWYLWVIRISGAALIAYIFIKALKFH
jgi:threonine/homoserine/homoserine lactone efflux protein